MKDTVNTRWNN